MNDKYCGTARLHNYCGQTFPFRFPTKLRVQALAYKFTFFCFSRLETEGKKKCGVYNDVQCKYSELFICFFETALYEVYNTISI